MRPISSQTSPSLFKPKDHLNFPTPTQPQSDNISGLDISPFQSNQDQSEGNYQWSDFQNRKYYEFLLRYKQSHLQLNSSGKVKKVNVQMSQYIQTRTSTQSRSHHQKMMKRFGHLEAVIAYFQAYFSRKCGQALCGQAISNILQDQPIQKMLIIREDHAQQSTLPWPVTAWDLRYSPALFSVEDDPPTHKE